MAITYSLALTYLLRLTFQQGWQGRWAARVAGRQKVATPSGSRGGKNHSGSLMDTQFRLRLEPVALGPSIRIIPLNNIRCVNLKLGT